MLLLVNIWVFMKNKINLNYIALFFIIPFSGYYITKLPLSPIYFFILFGSYLSVIILFLSKSIKYNKAMILITLFLIYLLITQLIFTTPNISAFVNFIFSLVVFLVVCLILHKTSQSTIIDLSEKLIYFSLPLLIYEAYYRISNPVFFVDFAEKGRDELAFYYFKINSIMYQDSNFVAIFILSLFFFLLYVKQYTNKKYYISFTLLFVLIFATLSRASIISLLIFLFLYQFRAFFYRYKKIVFIISVSIISFLIPILMEYRKIDDSFSTKFGIFERTFEYFTNATINYQLFGVGFGNAYEVLEIGAHNFFVTYFVESGLIGLLFILIIWTYILIKTKYKAGIVMFPFLLNGMSFATGAIPYLYVIFAVILVLESRREKNAT